jgi:hypothetical protein
VIYAGLSHPDKFFSVSLRRWYYSNVRRNLCVNFYMVQIWLTVIILSLNHLSIMKTTDVTNFRHHMKGGDNAVTLPSLIQIHGHKTCIQGLFDITQIHLQVNGYQFIEMIKHLPLVSGPGWSLKQRLVGVYENSMLSEISQMVYLCF